jgi:hypothetical protein
MKSPARFALLLALCLASLAGSAPARAGDTVTGNDTYAAIAYSPETGKYGYGHGYGNRWAAERAALKECKAADARIVTWVHDGFCALALGDDQSCWGVGWTFNDGATNTEAKQSALQECRARTTNARIVLCICSNDALDPEVH